MLKLYKNWKSDLSTYLQINDEVDTEFVDYFIEVLPPRTMNHNLVQIGEPYDHMTNGNAIYATLEKIGNKWFYKGHCLVGSTENQKGYYETVMENKEN